MPARRRRRGGRAARAGLGGPRAQVAASGRWRRCGSRSPRRGCSLRGRDGRSTSCSSATRATSTCRGAARRARAAGRLQPARLARGHVRRRPRPLPPGLARRARAARRSTARALGAADLVVADTERARRALLAELAAPRDRVEVCFVGAEERVFRPGWAPPERVQCLFVGKLIPLHGLETILAAARLAPELRVPRRRQRPARALLDDRPANVEWTRWIDYERLPDELQRAGCALGIFGTSAKAARVIPNKAFQALACGTPLVTADTPAARELLVDGESALLVPPGDPEALAAALRRLAADPDLARRLAEGGLAAYASARARTCSARAGARCSSALAREARARCSGRRSPRTRPASRRSRPPPPRVQRPAASTSGTWCRPSGRPRTATRSR